MSTAPGAMAVPAEYQDADEIRALLRGAHDRGGRALLERPAREPLRRFYLQRHGCG
ncbi:MAG: hypothetical protein R3C15_14615 [Thermoleophilia bacterium]